VDEDEVRPAALEPLDGLLAAVRGAVVDDPEDALGGGIGLLGHHLSDEPVERLDPCLGLRASEDSAAAHVPGGQVGERSAPLVGVLDPLPARDVGGWRQRPMDPPPRLDRGLLVGADHILAGVQQPALEASLVEVEHPAGLVGEVGIGGEDPGAVLPRPNRVLAQPAHDRRLRDLGDAALDDEPVNVSRRATRERRALARRLAGDGLDRGDLARGESGAAGRRAPCP
jgi:hypothetical protein